MKNKLLKFFRNSAIFLVVLGMLFSNIPFNVLTSTLDGYIKTRNIVDQAWNLKQNKNIVDNFSSFRNLLGKIKVYEAQAAISFVGKNTASGTNAAYNMSLTALTGGIASSPTEGDIVVVINAIANTANGNPGVGTAGYTESVDIYQGDTYDTNLSVSYKIMSASPDTTVSCNPSSSGTIASDCVAMVFRGIDTVTPLDVTRTTALAGNSEDVNCPAITPVTSGAIVLCAGSAAGASVDQAIPTAPTGYSGSTYIQTDPGNSGAAVASYKAWSGSGAEDPAAYAMDLGTASANSWAAATLALRPKNNLPSITVNTTDSPDPVTQGSNVTFSATATDSDSNNWYLAVCTTNAVTPGSGGSAPTCNVGTYCVSGSAVASGSQNTCAWTSSGSGAQNWYAFACDNSSFDTKCSSVDSTNSPVTVNVPSYTLTVGATGTQTSVVDSGTTTAAYLGGAFTFVLDSGSATLDSFIISEMGSTTANTSLTNVDIQSDTDGAYPGSTVTGCTGLPFIASQKLTCTPSGGLSLSSATTRYIYVVVNTISSGAAGGETIEIEITNAATEVTVTGATNGSSGTKAIGGTTTIRPNVTDVTDSSLGDGGRNGETFTITGAGFGTACGSLSVQVGTLTLTCNSANNTTISATIPSGQTTTYGGTGANGLLVTVGGVADDARQTYYIYPDITSVISTISGGSNQGMENQTDDITITGTRFGASQGTGGVKFQNCAGAGDQTAAIGTWADTSVSITVPSGIDDNDDACNILITRDSGTGSKTDTSINFVVLPDITGIIDDFGGADDTAREYDVSDSAANNTTADLKDGEIEIGGKHFGGAGTVTILGQTAAQAVVGTRCGGSSYTATCITVQISTTTSDSLYTGNVVVQRTSDSKSDSLSGFIVLPRITGFTPGSAAILESVTVNGNHFCQNGGVCPGAFDAADNYVIFNSNATATSFVSWNDTAMATLVPNGASTGNVFLRSNGYNSNAKSFTVNVPTPADPSNLWQSRNSAFTNLIATGGVASSTPVYLSATTSSGVGGGTMYMQTEMRPTTGGNSTFSSTSTCSSVACTGSAYCFEGFGLAYSGGNITATSSVTAADEFYHWQTRIRYNKTSTDYCSAWQCYPDPGCTEPSAAIDFEIDTVAPVISNASSTPSTNGATISWDTIGDLSTTQLEYGTSSDLSVSTFTAITDTPPETNGKTAGHSVTLSNLNSNTTYYYRARSKDSGNLEGTSSILNFPTNNVTEGPSKTTSFHIVGATGSIAGGSTATTTFAVIMPETASTTKSAFVEITGVYASGASSKDIAVQVNSQAARTYVVPASTTSFFKFIYQVSSVNPSNTLVITPQANTAVYISSAKIIINYAYTP